MIVQLYQTYASGTTKMWPLVSYGSRRANPSIIPRVLTALAILVVLSVGALAGTGAAHASSEPKRLQAFHWAVKHTEGLWYESGGTGPNGYDCSGEVMEAYKHVGIHLPRTTYEMLDAVAWGKLIPEAHPRKGDLTFYGSGHVELYSKGDRTFGAHATGQRIGWITFGWGWVPTMFFRVRGAG